MSEKSPPRTDRRRRPAKNFGGIFCRIDEKRYLCTRNGSPCGRHRRSGDEKGNGWKSRTVPAAVSSSAAWRTQAQALSTTDRRIGKVLRSERVRRPAVAAHARELTCGERGSRVERNQFNDSNEVVPMFRRAVPRMASVCRTPLRSEQRRGAHARDRTLLNLK